MRFLIINLTRMGDLIQTTPVLLGIKEMFPDSETTLLVNREFERIVPLLPGVDRVYSLDIRGIVNLLDRGKIVASYRYLKELTGTLNETPYDRVVNFTHSLDSAVLTSLIRAKDVRGVSVDEHGYSIKPDPWIRYFFNVIPSRAVNPFHLCDMHLKVAGLRTRVKGLTLQIDSSEMEEMRYRLGREGSREGEHLVGLQLGASAEDKQWPVEGFVELAKLLSDRSRLRVVITGAPSERDHAEKFKKLFDGEVIDMVGKTDLRELVSLIRHLDLFISNDTGPLHIATAVETPAINISLGSVHFRETGPYSEGDYVIKADIPCSPCAFESDCASLLCKRVITPEMVWKVANAVLNGRELNHEAEDFRDVQVYRSFFDNDGMVNYMPIFSRPLTKEMMKEVSVVNLTSDLERLQKALEIILTLREAWKEVGSQSGGKL